MSEQRATPAWDHLIMLDIQPHLMSLLKELARRRGMTPDQLAEHALESFLRIQARKYVEHAIAQARLEHTQ
jgi:hypothetical protein